METIITYVNNIFSPLPATKQLMETKENILNNMLDKYEELKAEGKSEHEAIGIVISEFGNIEELLEGLGIDYRTASKQSLIPLPAVKEFLATKKKAGLIIAAGVALCILGVIITQFFNGLVSLKIFPYFLDSDGDSLFGMAGLFVCVAIAVSLFLYSAHITSKFSYIENGVTMDASTKAYVLTDKENGERFNTVAIIIGVVLCILSPLTSTFLESFFGHDNDLCNLPFLFLVMIAVFLFVYAGCRTSAHNELLKTPAQTKAERRENRLYAAVNGTIVMIAAGIYLVFGFLYQNWESAGIIFPISGILCGISSLLIWGFTKQAQQARE